MIIRIQESHRTLPLISSKTSINNLRTNYDIRGYWSHNQLSTQK